MPISGTLATMSLSDVLQWLQGSHKSGTLSLTVNMTDTILLFKNGDVEAMQGGGALQRDLGQELVVSGLISEEQLFSTLQSCAPDQTLADALLAQDLVDATAIVKAQREHALEHLLDLFFSDEGSFHFVDVGSSEDLLTPLQVDDEHFFSTAIQTRSLLLEGMRRLDEWNRIRSVFSSDYTVVSALRGQESSNPVWQFLTRQDQAVSCGEICLRMGGRRFEVYQALYRAYQLGLVEPTDSGQAGLGNPPNSATSMLVDSARLLLQEQQFEEAIELLNIANNTNPQETGIRELLQQAQSQQLAALYQEIPPQSRPVLSRHGSPTENMQLNPRERYLAARLDGRWDVATLAMATPLGELETLRIIKKFHHAGRLEFNNF